MIPSQMLKGLLEGAILELISKKETYAYEISTHLEEYGFGEISEGTVYPIILRLQKGKYILGENRPSPTGPMRKYYSLTKDGEEYLKEFERDWGNLQKAMKNLFNDENGECYE